MTQLAIIDRCVQELTIWAVLVGTLREPRCGLDGCGLGGLCELLILDRSSWSTLLGIVGGGLGLLTLITVLLDELDELEAQLLGELFDVVGWNVQHLAQLHDVLFGADVLLIERPIEEVLEVVIHFHPIRAHDGYVEFDGDAAEIFGHLTDL